MKMCCVPQEPTKTMVLCGSDSEKITIQKEAPRVFTVMLSVRPPLPADIEAALALAEEIVSYRTKYQYREDDATMKISHALRKACGME